MKKWANRNSDATCCTVGAGQNNKAHGHIMQNEFDFISWPTRSSLISFITFAYCNTERERQRERERERKKKKKGRERETLRIRRVDTWISVFRFVIPLDAILLHFCPPLAWHSVCLCVCASEIGREQHMQSYTCVRGRKSRPSLCLQATLSVGLSCQLTYY